MSIFMTPVRRTLFTFGFLMMAAVPAFAQDTDSRLNRLENEIQTLSRAVFKGERPPPSAIPSYDGGGSAAQQAATEVRLSQMERELAALTGRLEEQDYQIRQLQEKLDDALAQMARASAPALTGGNAGVVPVHPMGSGVVAAPPSYTPPQTLGTLTQPVESGAVTTAAPANDPDGMYGQAFALIQKNDYAGAEQAFQAFLDRYPDHNLAGNAQYWLGETFYVRGQYDKAARVFAEGYQKYPKGQKGPDNLLKLGLTLAAQGKKDDACLTFGQLLKQYPTGANPILERTKREKDKLSCP
ncbi:MAG: tol-pal system protein YbgF [Rhodospirillales bacterium]|nr:tol-pal system protein YbgF [Rhodospirillales bacterium]